MQKKARILRNEMTAAEKKIWYEYLRNHNHKFLRQKPIQNYMIDFYCQKLKLAIEIDGETHITKGEMGYDNQRTRELNYHGIKVIRFWNNEIFDNFEQVAEKIEKEITLLQKKY